MPEKEIPEEINDHLKLFGKESWEVDYGEKCPLCNVRIDEYDMCGCGSTFCSLWISRCRFVFGIVYIVGTFLGKPSR